MVVAALVGSAAAYVVFGRALQIALAVWPAALLRAMPVDAWQSLLYGFSVSLTPTNLLYCALGVLLGTIVGVLPGIGPLGGITILLPTTFGMEPVSAIIMLAGIYYGAMYGGSTTSILVNIPGEAASVVTCFDGYQMARQGRAGPALSIAAIGSYVAGTLSVLGLMLLAPLLARLALKFGPPEQFASWSWVSSSSPRWGPAPC